MEISLEKNTHTHTYIYMCVFVCVCVCILEYWNGLPFKEMATHFSILAGEFHALRSLVDYSPWGRRVRHD